MIYFTTSLIRFTRTIPLCITGTTTHCSPVTGLATIFTNSMFRFYMSIATFFAAIFYRSIRCTLRLKNLTAILASYGFTIITKLTSWGMFYVSIVAYTAFTFISTIRKIMVKLWPFSPTYNFGNMMAFITKSYQIIQIIRSLIMQKQTKRFYMMNIQSFSCYAATLAGIIISLTCESRLAIPVRPPVIFVATSPHPIFRTTHIRTFHNGYYT